MATIHHQAYHHSSTAHHRRHRPLRRHSLDYSSLPSSSTTTSSLSLKPTTNISLSSHHLTFSLSATTTATPTTAPDSAAFSLDTLQRHLEAQNFRQADEETRRLLIVLAGEAAIKRGYVFFSEVQFISKDDLKAIDELWKKFSNGKFGYSVQRKIWLKVNKDFTRFFMKVGWMKKLDTEVEQYNYRSFPNEFIWELNPAPSNEEEGEEGGDQERENKGMNVPPEGHLPLTNALRGIQLLNCILNHPAFTEEDGGENNGGGEERENEQSVVSDEAEKKKSRLASLRDKLFKPNYSF